MRFNLVDRIVAVEDNRLIRAVKNLTLGEEYLADHFPTFPVMPGVLMLQALVEAGAWLWRVRDEFSHSLIVLKEAKNVKYGTFMEPGRQMQIAVELLDEAGDLATFKGKAESATGTPVSAKFTLGRSNLRDRNPALAGLDARIVQQYRDRYLVLCPDAMAVPI
jgi:3-hydroxyacyl-[acyl-carrier-protein] dehydratase